MWKSKNITSEYFVENCENIREQYEEVLCPFFNAKMVKVWKIMIYSLKIKLWQRDRIWEYLNGDVEYEELEKILEGKRINGIN